MSYKFSIFNTVIEKGDNEIVVYNSLTRAMARLKTKDFNVGNEELINKGFLVADNEDINMYKYFYLGRLLDNKNINISIATTMSCNLRCPYCFEEGNKSNEYMGNEVADSIVKYLVAKKNHNINITWFGGEPLMNFKAIEHISSSLNKNCVKYTASIITNGTLFTDYMILKLNSFNINSVQITLDGKQAQHDSKRFFANGKGSYNIIIENVDKLLRMSDTQVLLKVNLDKTNVDLYNTLCDSIYNKFHKFAKSKRLKITRNYVRNRTNFKGCETCMSEESYFDKFYDKHNAISYIMNIVAPCPLRSRSSFAIGPDGNIYKCLELLGNKKKSIGNMLNLEIDIKKQMNYAMAYSPFDNEECCNCSVLPLCGGGCPLDREQSCNINTENSCSIIKKRIKQIISDAIENQFILENNG